MRLNRYVLPMLILTAAACLAAFFAAPRSAEKGSSFTVGLVPAKGMAILSPNPVRVAPGGRAAFSVRFDEGCLPDDASPLTFEDGLLYLDGVDSSRTLRYSPRRPCAVTVRQEDAAYIEILTPGTVMTGDTVRVRISPPEHYSAKAVLVNGYPWPAQGGEASFPVRDDSVIEAQFEGDPVGFSVACDPAGSVRNLSERETYRYGDSVTLLGECGSDTVRFDGWSEGASLKNGGTPLSEEPQALFVLVRDTLLYANFTDTQTYTVTIDPNGGQGVLRLEGCSAGQSAWLPAVTKDLHRDGYALIGYDTRPDGTGRRYAPASPVTVGNSDAVLYAQWLPETPASALSFEVSGGYALIKGAAGPIGDTLVIPSEAGGAPVKAIDARAFAGGSFTAALVPLGVTSIGRGAFSGCERLATLYLPDSLKSVAEDAFDGCPALAHLRVLSDISIHAYERTFDAALADRYRRLLETPGKRIILVAGSSGSLGLDSRMLAARFSGYDVVNFSGSYLFGIRPMLSYVANNVHEGDVVVFAPEYYRGMYANPMTVSGIANWRYLESNYNMLDDLDMRNVRGSILDTFADFFGARRKLLPDREVAIGVYKRSAFNEYGDVALPRTHSIDADPFLPDISLISPDFVGAYSEAFSAIASRGGTCLFSFPPVSEAGADRKGLVPSYDAFTQKLRESLAGLPCTVISEASDYLFPAGAFSDNRYHMTSDGAVLRTQRLIADLEAYGLGN